MFTTYYRQPMYGWNWLKLVEGHFLSHTNMFTAIGSPQHHISVIWVQLDHWLTCVAVQICWMRGQASTPGLCWQYMAIYGNMWQYLGFVAAALFCKALLVAALFCWRLLCEHVFVYSLKRTLTSMYVCYCLLLFVFCILLYLFVTNIQNVLKCSE